LRISADTSQFHFNADNTETIPTFIAKKVASSFLEERCRSTSVRIIKPGDPALAKHLLEHIVDFPMHFQPAAQSLVLRV
jgi:hypothetical protein